MNNQDIEKTITKRLVESALEAGLEVSVGWAIKKSRDLGEILGRMFTTEEDTLFFFRRGRVVGWVDLVYGNGTEVISDHQDTQEMRDLLKPAEDLAEVLEQEAHTLWMEEQTQALQDQESYSRGEWCPPRE